MRQAAKNIAFILVIVGIISSRCYCQTHASAYLINSTDGLSNNRINDIFQDSKGFLWFGTNDGLNRYDGYEYTVYRHEIYDPSSISSGKVNAITEDNKGNIWVATNKGISMLLRNSDTFVNITFYQQDQGLYINETYDIVFSNDTSLWCILTSSLIRFNPKTGSYSVYSLDTSDLDSEFKRKVLFFDVKHNVLLLGTDTGVYYFDDASSELRSASLRSASIYDIFCDNEGTTWLASNLGLSKCIWRNDSPMPSDCELVYNGGPVRGISQVAENRLVLITPRSSILLDQKTHEIISEPYVIVNGKPNLPPASSILLDRSNNLWVGTFAGICCADLEPLKFSYFNTNTEPYELGHNMISSICSDSNKLYLGSWRGGFQELDLNSGTSKYFSIDNSESYYPEGGINQVYQDHQSRVWCLSEGIYLYDAGNESFTPVFKAMSIPGLEQIKGSRIYDIVEPDTGLFIIGHASGVYILDENNNYFENLSSLTIDSSIIDLSDVTSIEYKNGIAYIGGEQGLLLYDIHDKTHRFFSLGEHTGLAERILSMKIDSRGQLWLGTPSGLFLLDEEQGRFFGYSARLGFANDFIYSIEEDRNGTLWFSTNKGIINFDPLNGNIRNFGIQHGLSCMEFNLNSSCYSDQGIMFFGSINGVNFFCPDSLSNKKYVPNTGITGMKHYTHDNQVYFSTLPEQLSIHDNESLQIFFALLDYRDPLYKVYKYSLEGPKKRGVWHTIGNQNSVILSGFECGSYSFKVVGSDSDGQWSSFPAEFSFQVTAPFYRRKFFIGIMILPFVLLVFFLFEYRTKTLRQSNKALREKEIAAREVLRQKNLLSRRNKSIEDSLKYAQRIQLAMFTSEAEIRKMFPASFILQKPKDIVSGDFYWARKIGSKIFIAAADCTGHGVPGAFMSLIGIEFFRQIVEKQGVHKPSNILNEINKNFDLVFENMEDIDLRDGMDLSFCVVDTITNMLEYSGAFNPLYIIREGEIIEIKADKTLLGPNLGFARKPFTNHEFKLQKDDVIYLFSDGYADQFGGPEGKKFKYRRFRHLLLSIYDKELPLQKQILENSISDWKGAHEQVDDILVMGVKPVFEN